EGSGVKLVTLTVDPDYDTPEILTNYADFYDAVDDKNWLFLTGCWNYKTVLLLENIVGQLRSGTPPFHVSKLATLFPSGFFAGLSHYGAFFFKSKNNGQLSLNQLRPRSQKLHSDTQLGSETFVRLLLFIHSFAPATPPNARPPLKAQRLLSTRPKAVYQVAQRPSILYSPTAHTPRQYPSPGSCAPLP
ncbi:MAG: hypothetical protein AAF597_08575, partial [Bacteroidota bacterium]